MLAGLHRSITSSNLFIKRKACVPIYGRHVMSYKFYFLLKCRFITFFCLCNYIYQLEYLISSQYLTVKLFCDVYMYLHARRNKQQLSCVLLVFIQISFPWVLQSLLLYLENIFNEFCLFLPGCLLGFKHVSPCTIVYFDSKPDSYH